MLVKPALTLMTAIALGPLSCLSGCSSAKSMEEVQAFQTQLDAMVKASKEAGVDVDVYAHMGTQPAALVEGFQLPVDFDAFFVFKAHPNDPK